MLATQPGQGLDDPTRFTTQRVEYRLEAAEAHSKSFQVENDDDIFSTTVPNGTLVWNYSNSTLVFHIKHVSEVDIFFGIFDKCPIKSQSHKPDLYKVLKNSSKKKNDKYELVKCLMNWFYWIPKSDKKFFHDLIYPQTLSHTDNKSIH